MPNWCENELYVKGTKKLVAEFQNKAKGEKILDFNKFIPYPTKYAEADKRFREWREQNPNKSLRDAPEDGYNNGGYRWCIDNWGTKWNASHFEDYKNNPDSEDWGDDWIELRYKFDTAWAPPLLIIRKMAQNFPELEFTLLYFESGAEFSGRFTIKKDTVKHQEAPYFGHRGG